MVMNNGRFVPVDPETFSFKQGTDTDVHPLPHARRDTASVHRGIDASSLTHQARMRGQQCSGEPGAAETNEELFPDLVRESAPGLRAGREFFNDTGPDFDVLFDDQQRARHSPTLGKDACVLGAVVRVDATPLDQVTIGF